LFVVAFEGGKSSYIWRTKQKLKSLSFVMAAELNIAKTVTAERCDGKLFLILESMLPLEEGQIVNTTEALTVWVDDVKDVKYKDMRTTLTLAHGPPLSIAGCYVALLSEYNVPKKRTPRAGKH
jgi:hypothetical protein